MKDGYCGVPTLLNQAESKNWRRRKRETPLDLRGLRPFNDHPLPIFRLRSYSEACAGCRFDSPLMTDKNTSICLTACEPILVHGFDARRERR